VMIDEGRRGKTNILKIVKTSICKIPPTLPFPKGGITPLWPPAHRASLRAMRLSEPEAGPEGKEGDLEGFLQRVSCTFDVTPGAWEFLE
jgi:hypothetical protein